MISVVFFSFGSGQVSVGKFIGKICDLLGDANVQVRTAAIDSLVDIYHHVGVKVRVDLGKRGLPPAKLQQLFSRFDEIDVSSNNVNHGGLSDETSAEVQYHSLFSKQYSFILHTEY